MALGMRSTTAPSPPQPQATECGLTMEQLSSNQHPEAAAPSPPQPQATECGLTTVPGTAQQQSASRGRRLSNFKNLIEHFNWRLTRSTNFKLKIPRSAGCCRPCVGLFCCQRRRRRHRCKFLFAAPAGAGAAAAASAARTSRAVRRHLELLIYCKVCMCTLLWTIGFLSSPHTGVQQQLFK
eukprot:TRINITY_DN3095_c0_g1_i1.p1 TRINITY_DN3095_c0_g1~~TRINITY_DN3095_c0_g1_i1.p1  ORF type:complete len:181 (+),score=28.70 TRINITY_DN3095_c0_g1_i1:986-1528(+)